MKKISLMIFILLTVGLYHPNASAQETFTDLKKSKWAEASIYYLFQRETVAGYGNGKFGPNDTITRAQAVTYLVRELFPDEKAVEGQTYHDVGENHFFYKEISIATNERLIAGFPDGTFRPNSPISRAETTAILTRAYTLAKGLEKVKLTDIEKHWASHSINLLASNKLVGGYRDQTFRPNQPVTRAEFAVFLTRMIQFKRGQAIENEDWDTLLDFMTLKEKVGQMLMPDIRMWNGENTVEINQGISDTINNHSLGGLILFNKNIVDIEQLTTFTHQLQQQVYDIPLLLGIDQEGGVISRIPNGTNLPGNMALGATSDPLLAYKAGNVIGTELHALGVNVNFGPVLDINNNPNNPIIGIRSFGANPDLVSEMGMQWMKGQNTSGVISTVKHFPGHGDTNVDSHLGLPVLSHDLHRLKEVELRPFQTAINHGVDMVMTAHIAFPAIDHTQYISKKTGSNITIPATLSKKVLNELLRTEMGFEGVIISDAFTMNAISEHFGEENAVKMAVLAGVDIILMPKNITSSFDAILSAVKKGEIPQEQIDQSVKRILVLKNKYHLFNRKEPLKNRIENSQQIIGSNVHRAIEREIAEKSITLLKNEKNHLPYSIESTDKVAIIATKIDHANQMKEQLNRLENGNYQIDLYTIEDVRNNVELIDKYQFTILSTYQFRNNVDQFNWESIQIIIDRLNSQSKKYVNLSLGNPYELIFLRNVQTNLAAYGDNPPNIEASLKVILGKIDPKGTLPVSLH